MLRSPSLPGCSSIPFYVWCSSRERKQKSRIGGKSCFHNAGMRFSRPFCLYLLRRFLLRTLSRIIPLCNALFNLKICCSPTTFDKRGKEKCRVISVINYANAVGKFMLLYRFLLTNASLMFVSSQKKSNRALKLHRPHWSSYQLHPSISPHNRSPLTCRRARRFRWRWLTAVLPFSTSMSHKQAWIWARSRVVTSAIARRRAWIRVQQMAMISRWRRTCRCRINGCPLPSNPPSVLCRCRPRCQMADEGQSAQTATGNSENHSTLMWCWCFCGFYSSTLRSPSTVRAGTREVHNKLEKNRRAHLKECFEALKKQLPITPDEKKTSNLSILGAAIRHIHVSSGNHFNCTVFDFFSILVP